MFYEPLNQVKIRLQISCTTLIIKSILSIGFKQFFSFLLTVKRDCEVSPWSDWGPCSPRCGVGVSQRTRTVAFRPINGGRECPPLIENRGCFRTQCGGKEKGKHLVQSCNNNNFIKVKLPQKSNHSHRNCS